MTARYMYLSTYLPTYLPVAHGGTEERIGLKKMEIKKPMEAMHEARPVRAPISTATALSVGR